MLQISLGFVYVRFLFNLNTPILGLKKHLTRVTAPAVYLEKNLLAASKRFTWKDY